MHTTQSGKDIKKAGNYIIQDAECNVGDANRAWWRCELEHLKEEGRSEKSLKDVTLQLRTKVGRGSKS